MITKTIFCAICQEETKHVLTASPTGDVVATCSTCEHFIKFPAGIDKETFEKSLEEHKKQNEGQVTQESIDKTLAELGDPEEEPEKEKK